MLQLRLQSSSGDAYCLQVPGITRNDTLTGRKVNVAVLGECQCLRYVMHCLMRPAAVPHEGLLSISSLISCWWSGHAGWQGCQLEPISVPTWQARSPGLPSACRTPFGGFCFCCWRSWMRDTHSCLQRSSSAIPEPITFCLPCILSRQHGPESPVG